MPQYQLYLGNKNYSSWSLRPWVLLRERGIEFDEHIVPFSGGSNWESFRSFSPSGKVPCLVDGATTVWDSLAIAEYLAERHDGVWPGDSGPRTWARCAAAEMHSGFDTLRARCPMSCGLRVRLSETPAALRHDILRVDEIWREGIERFGGPFLAGEAFTAVDAMYAPVAFRVRTYGLELSDIGSAYSSMLIQRPSMQAWLADALAEPWREAAHEEELRGLGTILEDARS